MPRLKRTAQCHLHTRKCEAASGTANYVVPSNGTSGGIDLSSGTVTATATSETFVYDYRMVNGRATKAGDGEDSISGFDTAKDKLVFVDTTSHTFYTEAQFKVRPGVVVSENPITPPYTKIYFDPDAGVAGGVTLVGIVDAALSQIVVETM